MQTLTYQDAARHLLTQGFEELAAGDSPQASEKGWGAAAQMIKAIASHRGWKHNSHAALYRVIGRLVNETGDDATFRLFRTANALGGWWKTPRRPVVRWKTTWPADSWPTNTRFPSTLLHQNFYEDWGDTDYVATGLADIRELLDTLEGLLVQDTTG